MTIDVGQVAPDFTLKNQHGDDITLSSFRGRPVALVFFPFAFSGICTGELCEIRDNLDAFGDGDVGELPPPQAATGTRLASPRSRARRETSGHSFMRLNSVADARLRPVGTPGGLLACATPRRRAPAYRPGAAASRAPSGLVWTCSACTTVRRLSASSAPTCLPRWCGNFSPP